VDALIIRDILVGGSAELQKKPPSHMKELELKKPDVEVCWMTSGYRTSYRLYFCFVRRSEGSN